MSSFLHTQLFETWFGSVALTCDGLKSSVESWSVREAGRALDSGVCVCCGRGQAEPLLRGGWTVP